MASKVNETPFVKQLAASDRPTREKALSSLQAYLCCGRTFTNVELLKIWKGLFFCIFHTDRPLPQQRLSRSLASLLLPLPASLFLAFLHAFWTTMISYWSAIPSLRLDKYLYLIRQYIAHSFVYLAQQSWDGALLRHYLDLIEELPLSPGDGKVADGIRYHVCDVWVDGLVEVEGWEDAGVMRPVERLSKEGRTKTVRQRAAVVLEDERLCTNGSADQGNDEEEFEGFED